MSAPEMPPPVTQTSAAGAGAQTTTIQVGPGKYDLFAAHIETSIAYSETARISWLSIDAVGATTEIVLDSGYVSNAKPFAITNPRSFEGPGAFQSRVFHLASGTHTFRIQYVKVSP